MDDSVRSMSVPAIALRALVGAAAGWMIVEWVSPQTVPGWWAALAAATLALALVVAPATDRWAGLGVNSGWALATAAGLYLGVPETDRIVGMAPVLGIVWLAELSGRMKVDAFVVAGLDVVLVWAAVGGAVTRSGAMIAGMAMLGLLVVAPAIDLVTSSRGTRPEPVWTVPVLLGIQFVFVVVVARVGGVRTTAGEALVVVAVAVPLLALAAAPIIGRRVRA